MTEGRFSAQNASLYAEPNNCQSLMEKIIEVLDNPEMGEKMGNELKIGIIGFDTSHVTAFTKLLNDENEKYHVEGGKVICGFPSFSPDIETRLFPCSNGNMKYLNCLQHIRLLNRNDKICYLLL